MFIGFVCTKRTWKLYRKKLQYEQLRTSSNASTKTTIDTTVPSSNALSENKDLSLHKYTHFAENYCSWTVF